MLRNEVNQRFCFLTEFYDPSAALVRHYQVFYYPSDGAIEIYDPKENPKKANSNLVSSKPCSFFNLCFASSIAEVTSSIILKTLESIVSTTFLPIIFTQISSLRKERLTSLISWRI